MFKDLKYNTQEATSNQVMPIFLELKNASLPQTDFL